MNDYEQESIRKLYTCMPMFSYVHNNITSVFDLLVKGNQNNKMRNKMKA